MCRTRALALAAILPLGSSVAAKPETQVSSADAVAKAIETKGPERVLDEFEKHPDLWADALARISKGEPPWLGIAASLRGASDAGFSDELDLAVADAVEHQPSAVLAILGRPFEVRTVCGNEESLGRDFKQALATLQRRRAALLRVTDKNHQEEWKHCIKALDSLTSEAKAHRKEWFGPP